MAPRSSNESREMFRGLDQDNDSLVSLECLQIQLLESSGVSIAKDELASLIGKSALNVEEFALLYNSIEIQNDVEFVAGDENCVEEELDCVKKAFRVFDVDGDGFICGEELEIVLKRLGIWNDDHKGKNEDSATVMICKFDKNFDGLLDFEEFKTMVMSQ